MAAWKRMCGGARWVPREMEMRQGFGAELERWAWRRRPRVRASWVVKWGKMRSDSRARAAAGCGACLLVCVP